MKGDSHMADRDTIVVVDSCCDIPADVAEKYGIRILPVHIIYPDQEYEDGVNIDPRIVYKRGPEIIPKTSMPSPGEVEDFFDAIKDDGYSKVIAITLSSRLSGTWNVIRMTAEDMDDLDIFVFDTKNISIGSGVFAIWAARKLEEGMTFEEITAKLPEKIHDSHLMFYMDTLVYLAKGGRIGNVTHMIASVLNIKPIISCDQEGVYYTVAKIRGARKSKEKLLSEIVSHGTGRDCWAVVMNGGAREEGDRMLELVKEKLPHAEIIFDNRQITASLAAHTGPGLVGMLVFLDP